MEFVISTRAGAKLLNEGFVYCEVLDCHLELCQCELRRNNKQCKTRIHVSGDQVVIRVNEHTHAPDIGRPEAMKIRQAINRLAVNNEETSQQIITQELRDVSDSAAVKLPVMGVFVHWVYILVW
jgi:hypothetical protein